MRYVVSAGCLVVMVLAAARLACAAEFSLWPMLEIDQIYDNNVDLTPTHRKGDFVTAETFGATLEAATATRDFFLTYQTYLLEYASYAGHDRFGNNHFANLRDDERLSPATSLSITDSLLVGNAVSNGILANGATPIGTQLMQSLFYRSSVLSNYFAMDVFSRYSDSFRWTANIHQGLFATLSSGSSSSSGNGIFFDQGTILGGEWDLPERFAAGFGYQFDDFRSSASGQPSAETNWPQIRMRWGDDTPFSFRAQVGPIISDSSSGSLVTTDHSGNPKTTTVPAQTQVEVGYFVGGGYHDRRLTVTASAAQQPGFGAGFGFATNAQTYGVLVNYKLSRRATVFVNGGYYTQSQAGATEQALTYTGGINYRLNKYFTLSANYVGYQTKASGSAVAGTIVAVPGTRTTVNLFQVGVTFAPPPLKWGYQ
jgi:hypothetical protein